MSDASASPPELPDGDCEVPVCEIHARTVARWGADAEAKRGNALAVVERTSGRRVVATDSTAVLKFRAAFAEFICMVNAYAYLQSILVSLREREHGQTMAEYAVVLAVITVAIVATLGFLAGGINKALSSVTSKL